MDEERQIPLPPRPLRETTGNFDNGAIGTRTSSSDTRKPKKLTKKKLLEELLAVKSELANMKARSEHMAHEVESNSTSESCERHHSVPTINESLLATVSNMSLGSLNIPECKPSEGESDVDKKAYEDWKVVLNASFSLVRLS